MPIHPTAIVSRKAQIAADAEVGAYSVIEPGVTLESGVRVWHHAFIAQGTHLGRNCQVHPFAVIGHHPQDLKWNAAPSFTQIGEATVLREGVAIHRGTMPDSTTKIGARCFFMANSHAGHNCDVADDVTLANGVLLAGHVQVGHRAFLSGNSVVHQFSRIGELVMIQGGSVVIRDVAPFMMFAWGSVSGLNLVGLKRAGITPQERAELRTAYRLLFTGRHTFPRAVAELAQLVRTDAGQRLLAFVQASSRRGYERLRRRARFSSDTAMTDADE